ncbi:helix-turn-helix transcriptional regulator [Streptomyces sp. NPDC046332]|uniref:helix-turn-helix domain-containing protein n=1 Tax=unclassified Streptomyces TaxID=2593676 RepID=UPI0033F75BB9
MALLASLSVVGYCRCVQPDGPKIRRQREHRGYGLRRFANAAQINAGYLSRIERGLRSPQPEVMKRIADILGCRIVDLERSETENNDERDDDRLAVHDDGGAGGDSPHNA